MGQGAAHPWVTGMQGLKKTGVPAVPVIQVRKPDASLAVSGCFSASGRCVPLRAAAVMSLKASCGIGSMGRLPGEASAASPGAASISSEANMPSDSV